jgi:diaminohydroxyphosphoribosylaminopyrimidine deaminase/5-amino-6-(5-phosphoribosylamino)uracil reductase
MQQYMQRAIELAKLGLGRTYPNPLVGCVIVRKGEIIGEGWHRKAGEAHAEVHAINSVRNREGLRDACLYVNLEPCAHQGKTPPCCDLIIKHKIPKVVIANIDPHDKVAGQGIARLKEAGTEVILGVCASEGEQLNRRFFTVHQKKRPYVVLKWAESRDGFMDAERQHGQMGSIAISGAESRSLSHLWRTQEESILVGRRTAEVDDPLLNTRAVHGRSPAVVLIDPHRKLKLNQLRMMDAAQRQFIRISRQRASGQLHSATEEIVLEDTDAASILNALFQVGLSSVLIEGGRKTLNAFIDTGLWDEYRVFRAPHALVKGLAATDLPSEPHVREQVGKDLLLSGFHP